MVHEVRTKRTTNRRNKHMNDKKATIKGNSSMLEMVRGSKAQSSAYGTVTLQRDDDLPLQFTGQLIGCNEIDGDPVNGTLVTLFATKSGKIITAVYQWQRGKGRERHAAAAHQMPQDALTWLKADGGGYLGKASREAWEAACAIHPAFQGHDVEVID